jgi:hypothetical protein
MDEDFVSITKLEGAERLLKPAVLLFFDEGDMLAAHSLAGSHEVLRKLSKRANKEGSILKDALPSPQPLIELLNHTHNFLKHADRDPDHILDYHEDQTHLYMFDAIVMFSRLTGGMKYREFAFFVIWFLLQHKELLKQPIFAEYVASLKIKEGGYSKRLFNALLKSRELYPLPGLI